MKTTLILALALVLGTGTTFGVMGCNKATTEKTEKKVTTETKTPEGAKTETTTESKTEMPKAEPEKK
jgi:hypothetical protein